MINLQGSPIWLIYSPQIVLATVIDFFAMQVSADPEPEVDARRVGGVDADHTRLAVCGGVAEVEALIVDSE